jgi:hypothetical protein
MMRNPTLVVACAIVAVTGVACFALGVTMSRTLASVNAVNCTPILSDQSPTPLQQSSNSRWM